MIVIRSAQVAPAFTTRQRARQRARCLPSSKWWIAWRPKLERSWFMQDDDLMGFVTILLFVACALGVAIVIYVGPNLR
jgi:hypothetical protein